MENLVNDINFWHGKKVFLTGHTGFKGSWLSIWLHQLGADVTGYALGPPTSPSLYELAEVADGLRDIHGDMRDLASLQNALRASKAEIVIHMAAQSLVRQSYKSPLETFATNVTGTVNLFEAVRTAKEVRAVLNVTSDKCYENREWLWGYRENEPLGGYDPYSASKACAELVTASYRNSFFNSHASAAQGVAVASARAGNVIGGGDWSKDRLVPDCIRAIQGKQKIILRNPRAVRPWQHVLEPLSGYLLLAEKLYRAGAQFGEAWNFGPYESDSKSVEWLVNRICAKWGENSAYEINDSDQPHEALNLKLDCSKAYHKLGWKPRWNIEQALDHTVEWHREHQQGKNIRTVCSQQIRVFQQL